MSFISGWRNEQLMLSWFWIKCTISFKLFLANFKHKLYFIVYTNGILLVNKKMRAIWSSHHSGLEHRIVRFWPRLGVIIDHKWLLPIPIEILPYVWKSSSSSFSSLLMTFRHRYLFFHFFSLFFHYFTIKKGLFHPKGLNPARRSCKFSLFLN